MSYLQRTASELKSKEIHTLGFLGYPVLQASDILIYKADYVPVGRDQLPHLELTREIVRRFAYLYKSIFPEPEPILTQTSKLLGIDNRKMSKSYDNYIALSDTDKDIRTKVMSMITDPKRIRLFDPGHPNRCNVCAYYKVFRPDMKKEVEDWCRNAKIGCTECKRKLAEVLIDALQGIRTVREKLLKDKTQVEKTLEKGTLKARAIASKTMKEVKELLGI
jgi:tryptophanyl-tRNA synthetase